MLRGAHRRRGGVDVEGHPSQRVGVVGQAHRRGGTALRRVDKKTQAGNDHESQERGDPPRDCAGN